MNKTFEQIVKLIERQEVKVSDHGYDELSEEENKMRKRDHTKLIHEGEYVAEVDVELIDTDEGWSPYLSLDDAYKLDEVREALRKGNLKKANKISRVFTLTPVSV